MIVSCNKFIVQWGFFLYKMFSWSKWRSEVHSIIRSVCSTHSSVTYLRWMVKPFLFLREGNVRYDPFLKLRVLNRQNSSKLSLSGQPLQRNPPLIKGTHTEGSLQKSWGQLTASNLDVKFTIQLGPDNNKGKSFEEHFPHCCNFLLKI